MKIIRATPNDVGLVATLFAEYRKFYGCSPAEISEESFLRDRIARDESAVFLALDSPSDPLGFVQLYPTWSSLSLKRLWILNDLFVALKARRRGVARQLIDRSVQLARDTDAKGLVLETAFSNAPARALYERLGWRMDCEFARYSLDL